MRNLFIFIILFQFSALFAQYDWTLRSTSNQPVERYGHGMSYITNGKCLLFGGDYGTYIDDTWIYDLAGNTWTEITPATKPKRRRYHDMEYISGDLVLLFGGYDGDRMGDTWIYDYSEGTWDSLELSTAPVARYSHRMARIADGKILLFGGYDGALDDETWLFDIADSSWTQLFPSSSPSVRFRQSMSYIGDDKVLLFGGYDATDSPNGETWVYDLSDAEWTQMAPSGDVPAARYRHDMVYIGDDKAMMFGGWDGSNCMNDTWIYDLSDNQWTEDLNSTQPSARFLFKIAETSWDGTSYIAFFGGADSDGNIFDDTWTFGGGDSSLPVELASFSAISGDKQVTLKWITESEINNDAFILERSFDGENFVFVEEIEGQGSSNVRTMYTYTDHEVDNGITYYYRLADRDFDGYIIYLNTVTVVPSDNYSDVYGNIDKITLYANYPNPFNPETVIPYTLSAENGEQLFVRINVFNIFGQKVVNLFEGYKASGNYEIRWNGKNAGGMNLPTGVYYLHIQAGNFVKTQKMMLLR